jgi:kynurenine 3-monooxygenase
MAAERVVVVGAGPAGSMVALLLARRGFEVDVYERRPDMRVVGVHGGRSINLAVSTRGLKALAAVGLRDSVLAEAVPMRGRMTHAVDGATALMPYGRDDSECIHSMSRGGINIQLMNAAEATGRVRIHFNQRLRAYDIASSTAHFHDEVNHRDWQLPAPVLFGTDGTASALRTALVGQGAQFTEDLLDFGYKELTIPAASAGAYGQFALYPHALHIWPRGRFMLIALPNLDGSFTCTLFLPFTTPMHDAPAFDHLLDATSVEACFRRWFPDTLPHLPDLAAQLLSAPLGRMVTLRGGPWHHSARPGHSVVLLGDAAHAIVPFFGQGMNASFEDCSVLAECLDAGQGPPDWPVLMAELAAARKPNTDAIAALALENFIEMRDKVADAEFLLHRAVEAKVAAQLPGYRTRYQIVTFTNAPYTVALEAGAIQAQVLGAACAGKTSVEQVDVAAVAAAMQTVLLPLLHRHGIH